VYVAEYMVMRGDVLVHPPGTEHTKVMRLTTIWGASKRIRKSIIPEGAVKCNIYSVGAPLNRETYKLVKVMVLMDYHKDGHPIWA
jgi:hypothetical protein